MLKTDNSKSKITWGSQGLSNLFAQYYITGNWQSLSWSQISHSSFNVLPLDHSKPLLQIAGVPHRYNISGRTCYFTVAILTWPQGHLDAFRKTSSLLPESLMASRAGKLPGTLCTHSLPLGYQSWRGPWEILSKWEHEGSRQSELSLPPAGNGHSWGPLPVPIISLCRIYSEK